MRFSLPILTASAAGLFHYNNDGALLNPDDSPSLARPFMGWGTGSGLSYYAGLVHHAEVDQDVIPHAIRFSYSCAHSSDQFRAPATKTDQPHPICGGNINPDADFAMDMGMRLQLDPAVDCDARTTPAPSGASRATPSRSAPVRLRRSEFRMHLPGENLRGLAGGDALTTGCGEPDRIAFQ